MYIEALAVLGTNIVAGTLDGVFLSTDDGNTWTPINAGLPDRSVFSMAVNGANLFVGTDQFVFLTSDNGTNWLPVTPNLTYTRYLAFAVYGKNIFAATAGSGIFVTSDNGTHWKAVNTGLMDTYVRTLGICGTNLFAGSMGVWRRPLSELVTGIENPSGERTHFALQQNYPNPFNPATTISFTTTHSGLVKLVIHDLFGSEIATLVNDSLDPGEHRISFEASGLPSGQYIYTLTAEGKQLSKVMTVLK